MRHRKFFLLLALLLVCFSKVHAAESPKWVEHTFHDGETLWFVSQIYYGTGARYPEIMKLNHLTSTEGLKDGQLLKIPHPLFTSDQPGFEVRLSHLHLERADALAKRLVASEPSKPVVIPKTKPKKDDFLPIVEIHDPNATSPREKAKSEVGGH